MKYSNLSQFRVMAKAALSQSSLPNDREGAIESTDAYCRQAIPFVIEDELGILLRNTKSERAERRLPYPVIYINSDVPLSYGKTDFVEYADDELKTEVKGKTFKLWGALVKQTGDNTVGILAFLKANGSEAGALWSAVADLNEPHENLDGIQNFIINFIDVLSSPDIVIRDTCIDAQRNKTRAARGKSSIPSFKRVTVTPQVIKRMGSLASCGSGIGYSHRFVVRGHFSRLWNKEHWRNVYASYGQDKTSRYYKDEKNDVLMTWIQPYIKGKGVLVRPNYEVKSGNPLYKQQEVESQPGSDSRQNDL